MLVRCQRLRLVACSRIQLELLHVELLHVIVKFGVGFGGLMGRVIHGKAVAADLLRLHILVLLIALRQLLRLLDRVVRLIYLFCNWHGDLLSVLILVPAITQYLDSRQLVNIFDALLALYVLCELVHEIGGNA